MLFKYKCGTIENDCNRTTKNKSRYLFANRGKNTDTWEQIQKIVVVRVGNVELDESYTTGQV